MPGGLLHRLFDRSSKPSPEVVEALAELARHAQARPTLAAPIALLHEVLPVLFADPGEETVPQLSPGAAHAKQTSGIPLLRGESVALDVPAFRRRWHAICAAVQRHQNPDAGKALDETLECGRLIPVEMLASALAGRPEEIHAQADDQGLDAGPTTAVLGLTLFPALSRINERLASLRQGIRWEQGNCPTCGSWPLLGEFRGLEQTRYLRCGLCAAEWEFPRLLCPFCGERDHRQLGYFGVEGEELRYRATTCDACRGYVKMVATLAPLSAAALLVANVATLHLDLAAADRGYLSPP